MKRREFIAGTAVLLVREGVHGHSGPAKSLEDRLVNPSME